MRRRHATAASCGLLLAALLMSSLLQAQEMEPRSYSNAPVGMNFLVAGLGYVTGDVATDPAVALENTKVDAWLPVVGYARALDLWGKSATANVVVPFACESGSTMYQGNKYERDICGWGDPSFKLSVNLYGAPAMTLRELAGYRQNVIIGAGLRVSAPLGQYNSDKLLNIGTNRWSFKPEIGISKAWGRVIVELIGGGAFYTDNDDYFGHRKREQDPIYSLQAHAIYSFRSGAWLAFDATAYRGGRSTIDGVQGDDLQRNSRLGLTYAMPINRRNSLKIAVSRGATTRIGGDYDAVLVIWQHRWGGGL